MPHDADAVTRRGASIPRVLLTVALLATIGLVIGFQWNSSHVFNPGWHPHARFHAAQLVSAVSVLGAVGVWCLWRRPAGPRASGPVALGLVCFWGGEFFALVVPGTSASPDLSAPNTFSLLGWEVHGNLFMSALLVLLSAGAGLAGRPSRAVPDRVPASSPR